MLNAFPALQTVTVLSHMPGKVAAMHYVSGPLQKTIDREVGAKLLGKGKFKNSWLHRHL